MSCWHGGYHGCGPWCGPAYGPSWYEPADWYEDAPPAYRRRRAGYRRYAREASADELEARLADLRDEMRRVELELSDLRRQEEGAAAGS
jgi:uncharacterized small protein (DUF1192 family)